MTASVFDLKQSLLLIHGAIYGQIKDSIGVVQFSGLTNSIEQYDYAGFDWDSDVPYAASFITIGSGSMTDNTPIDVAHWNVGGNEPYDILSPWRGCMGLLVRI